MPAAAFRLLSFVALAAGSTVLWIGFLHSGRGEVGIAPAIPPLASQSIFAPTTSASAATTTTTAGLKVSGVVTAPACPGCTLHVGSGGLVRAEVGRGATFRKAYALLDLGNRGLDGSVVARDVIGLGRGDEPVAPVRVAQMLDSARRVIFELVTLPDRKLELLSPPGGVRAGSLSLPLGVTVPNDGVSGVAVEVAMQRKRSLSVYVNGVRTATVSNLAGATTAAPRYLATGVIGYVAPADAPPITAVHTQVSVSTPTTTTSAPSQPTPPQPTPQPPSGPSASSPPVTPQAPRPPLANTSPPTVSGIGVVGSTLTAGPGSWTAANATFSYTWQRCDATGACTSIDGAVGPTYKVTADDRGALVRVHVTATAAGDTASKTSAAVGPVLPVAPLSLSAPAITGDAIVGATLTATLGTWDDRSAALSIAWRRCDSSGNCLPIAGANDQTYIVTGEDVGFTIRVRVTATNAGGSAIARSTVTAAVVRPVPVPPSPTGTPFVSGRALVGAALTANPGTWTDPSASFAFSWQRCDANGSCSSIDGATGNTYSPTPADLGQKLRVEVTATGANGASATADSDAVGPVTKPAPVPTSAPSVGGTPTVSSTLSGNAGTWSDPDAAINFQWQRCDAGGGSCTAIGGATGQNYTLTGDDLGSQIRLEVTASNGGGSRVADSATVGPVTLPSAPVSTTAPAISGKAEYGSTLTADPGLWSDPSAKIAYQWQRCPASSTACTAIADATAATYVVTADDIGSRIRVEVTATNAGGTGTADSDPVGPVPPAPVSAKAPTVSGEATYGSTLSADPGVWTDPDARIAYQWQRCVAASTTCTPIAGATAATYVVTADDVGTRIRVEVTATNAVGSGVADSASVGPVPPATNPGPGEKTQTTSTDSSTPPDTSGDGSGDTGP
jgi:hypothetical protein